MNGNEELEKLNVNVNIKATEERVLLDLRGESEDAKISSTTVINLKKQDEFGGLNYRGVLSNMQGAIAKLMDH